MSRIDDVRKTIETAVGALTPAKAQQLAKGLLEPDAAKEQVAKTAGDLLEWSHRNRRRLRDMVRREIRTQLEQVGVASRSELDALKKRVRELERDAGKTASGRRAATRATTAKTPAKAGGRKKTSASATRKTTTRSARAKSTAASRTRTGGSTTSAGSERRG